MGRESILLTMFDPSTRGLEIGGSFNPLIPKSSGLPIDTLDHASAEELRLKYKDDPHVDINRIEEVDYVADGRRLPDVIGRTACYDYIIASHVIEHTTNMLGFLIDCAELLTPAGTLVLAVPDKRRCFDIFQPLSSTGDVLQAHLDARTRHKPGKVFDHYAYLALRDGQIGWAIGSATTLSFGHDLAYARSYYDKVRATDAYEDVHAWHFTPASFRLIINDLSVLGELALREKAFAETPGVEFFTALSFDGSGCPFDRLTLSRMILAEQYEMVAEDPPKQAPPAPGVEERLLRLEAMALHRARA